MSRSPTDRNQSPYGWWIASYVLRASWVDEPVLSDVSPCLSWENTILLQAPDREAAFKKATLLGSSERGDFWDADRPERRGRWVFEGLTELLPVYEELGDGCELRWTEREDEPLGQLRSRIRSKHQLALFDDDDPLRRGS